MTLKYRINTAMFKLFEKIGLVKISNLRKAEDEAVYQFRRYKEEKALRAEMQLENNLLRKRIDETYPHKNDSLKMYVGQHIEVTGVYYKWDNRGVMIKFVNKNKTKLCDHMWLKGMKKPHFKRGDIVKVSGVVEKYGSMSWQKPLTENYSIDKATMKKGY
jgi:hypothetical protein